MDGESQEKEPLERVLGPRVLLAPASTLTKILCLET